VDQKRTSLCRPTQTARGPFGVYTEFFKGGLSRCIIESAMRDHLDLPAPTTAQGVSHLLTPLHASRGTDPRTAAGRQLEPNGQTKSHRRARILRHRGTLARDLRLRAGGPCLHSGRIACSLRYTRAFSLPAVEAMAAAHDRRKPRKARYRVVGADGECARFGHPRRRRRAD